MRKEITFINSNEEEQTIMLRSLTAKSGSLILKRISNLFEKAKTDDSLRASINGLLSMFDKENNAIDFPTMMLLLPSMSSTIFDELLGLISDMSFLPVEDLEELELEELFKIANELVQINDFSKIFALLKNSIPLKIATQDLKVEEENQPLSQN